MRTFDQLAADFGNGRRCSVSASCKVLARSQVHNDRKEVSIQPTLPAYEAFNTHGIADLEVVKLMFGFTQTTGCRYFGPESRETETAAREKRVTAMTL